MRITAHRVDSIKREALNENCQTLDLALSGGSLFILFVDNDEVDFVADALEIAAKELREGVGSFAVGTEGS